MNMNWKCELKLQEASVLNNVEKDGQIICGEQVNRDQEPNEDKLFPTRRLPTMRHDDFLWLNINMNH